ncbi:MAG: helix-turn-helix transcriptional regulator [Ruminococcaceae bacterium]|nr:helix-turn-helix transcriptional regulator [Oscillospiraceae bacterium]
MTFIIEKVEQTDRFGKYNLTPRQKEIAILLLAAKTRRQIAGELGVSESTVKNHTSELYKKLGINSRIELFRIFGIDEEKSE